MFKISEPRDFLEHRKMFRDLFDAVFKTYRDPLLLDEDRLQALIAGSAV